MDSQTPDSAPPPHLGPIVDEKADWQRFESHELAMVLSHYDLGVISSIRPYTRGSRRAPKLRIKSDRGEFLLKRRAPARQGPFRVAFTHAMQLYLAGHGYPVARLIGTRDENNSMLQLNGRTYELFEFVEGRRTSRSPAETRASGAALGDLHRLLTAHESPYEAPVGSFHAMAEVNAKLHLIPDAVGRVEPGADRSDVAKCCRALEKVYAEAARRVVDCGYEAWSPCLLHGDWHPGNLLFRDDDVVAVLDFDSARREPRMVDVANAALQFSMRMDDPDDPAAWPTALDAPRIQLIVRGYDDSSETPLRREEREALPWLMIEALIVESVIPIAAAGSFARLSGAAFLAMVARKVSWLRPRSAKLAKYLER